MECNDNKNAKLCIPDKPEDIYFKTKVSNTCRADILSDDIPQIRNRILSIAKEILGLSKQKVPVENK